MVSTNILDTVLDSFILLDNKIGRNVITFGVDMSSSSHINYKRKDILILKKGPRQGLEHTLTAEKYYEILFKLAL